MVWNDASFWLLVILCVAIYVVATPAQRTLREAEKELSAEELKTFRDSYLRRSARQDMPTKFNQIADAQSRLSRIWIVAMLAVIAAIMWIIYAGPTLGLF